MKNEENSLNSSPQSGKDSNSNCTYFERWKHFESVGGADKERMVTLATWLLAFATAILAFLAAKNFDYGKFCFMREPEALVFSLAGIFICINALYLISAFGSYANLNWFIANSYAKKVDGLKNLIEQKIQYQRSGISSRYYNFVAGLSCRHDPEKGLAPIFIWFLRFTAALLILFFILFAWSLLVVIL